MGVLAAERVVVGGRRRARAVEGFEDLVFGEVSCFWEISCLGGDSVLLGVVGGLLAHYSRAMASGLARPRPYLFPPTSETLPPPWGDTAPALRNWQEVVPTRHKTDCYWTRAESWPAIRDFSGMR